jgi:predicted nucleotidyltransferase
MIVADETLAFKVIKESISELLPESSILLFGSRARHDHSEDSDYDLMIITKDFHEPKQVRLFKSLIRKKLAHNHIPADIIIQSKAEVESKKKITGHIVRQALMEGIPL